MRHIVPLSPCVCSVGLFVESEVSSEIWLLFLKAQLFMNPQDPDDPLSLMALIAVDEYFQKFRETFTL